MAASDSQCSQEQSFPVDVIVGTDIDQGNRLWFASVAHVLDSPDLAERLAPELRVVVIFDCDGDNIQ